MERKEKRNNYLDIAKGIAIISIIIGHLDIEIVNRIVFTYHIPVFLLITGYFMNEKRSIKEFAINRLRTLMIPYAVTCIVIILLGTLEGFLIGNPVGMLKRWVMASAYGSGGTYYEPFMIYQIGAIWYLPASYVAGFVLRLSLKYSYRVRICIIGMAFAIGYLSSKYLFWFPMSIQAGLCCAIFMYIGWHCRNVKSAEISKEIKVVVIIISLIAWISFIIQFQGFYLVNNYYGRGIVDFISSICASMLIVFISYWINETSGFCRKILIFAGRYSLLILCVHIVELNLVPWNTIIMYLFGISHIQSSIILLFIKPVIILVIVAILSKMRIVRKVYGYE